MREGEVHRQQNLRCLVLVGRCRSFEDSDGMEGRTLTNENTEKRREQQQTE